MFIGRQVLVVGAARSGIAAAEVLLQQGAQVTLTDIAPLEKMPVDDQRALKHLKLRLVLGSHPLSLLDGVDLIVKNPGIPPGIPLLDAARRQGIEIISELELAYLLTEAEVVAVTGTNGKTTTTALIGTLLGYGRRPVAVGGNIGLPLTKISQGKSKDWLLAVEASSFQLEDCYQFHPRVAVYTNITPDHLDRHGTMESYIAAKARLLRNQTSEDYVVLNLDDPFLSALPTGASRVIGYSLSSARGAHAYISEGWFCWEERGAVEPIAPLNALHLPGVHNQANALAAIAAAKVSGVTIQQIRQGLQDFRGVEHRLEFVAEVGGVLYYNDSKATNPDSTITALRSFEDKVILLAGGFDKGADFDALTAQFANKVKLMVTFGDTGYKLCQQAKAAGFAACKQADDLSDAFAIAAENAREGDCVLLSPACASWDAFSSFEERGLLFKELVSKLGG
ncbi:MAG: UDP-N-acetylmuramoyl-L-alanine--D-glutamate ligase [Firmicutes bacterium]|nr:UDP-N-acetylmuramoyl-L-alanine--D-glutamate ligase [Bacillota bacterium]